MKRWLYLRHFLGAFLLMLAYSLVTSGTTLMILPVVATFGFPRGAFTVYHILLMVPNLLLSPFLGRLLERWGARRMIVVGAVWGALALAGLGFCRTLPQFYFCFLLGGFAFSPASSYVASVLLNSWFQKNRSFFCAAIMAGTGAGGMLWGVMVPPLVEKSSYRAGYWFCSLLWLVLMLLCTFLVRGLPREVGAAAYGAPEIAAAAGDEASAGTAAGNQWSLLWERRFLLLIVANFSLSLVNSFFTHAQPYLIDHHYSAVQAGYVISLFNVALVVCKLLLGMYFEHCGLYRGIVLPAAVDFLALTLLFLGREPFLAVAVVLFAVNSSLVAVTPLLSAGLVYNAQEFSAAWGILSAVGGLGNSVGAPLWGLVYDTTGSYRAGFVLAAMLLCLWGLLYRTILRRAGRK